jgi:toxin ParE1/3/4
MSVVQKTVQAENDLLDAWIFIASDSFRAADALLDKLEKQFSMLADNPLMGTLRPDIAPDFHFFPSKNNYFIMYRPIPNGIEVVRVLHMSRDLLNIF